MYTSQDGKSTDLLRQETKKDTVNRRVAWPVDVLLQPEELVAFPRQNLPEDHRFEIIKSEFSRISFDFTYASPYFFSRCCAQQGLSSTRWNGENLTMAAYGYVGEARNTRWEIKKQNGTTRDDIWITLVRFSVSLLIVFSLVSMHQCVFFDPCVLSTTTSTANNHICIDMHIQYCFLIWPDSGRSHWKEVVERNLKLPWLLNFCGTVWSSVRIRRIVTQMCTDAPQFVRNCAPQCDHNPRATVSQFSRNRSHGK